MGKSPEIGSYWYMKSAGYGKFVLKVYGVDTMHMLVNLTTVENRNIGDGKIGTNLMYDTYYFYRWFLPCKLYDTPLWRILNG